MKENGTIVKFQTNSDLRLDIKCYCNTKQLCKECTFINEKKGTFHFILFQITWEIPSKKKAQLD